MRVGRALAAATGGECVDCRLAGRGYGAQEAWKRFSEFDELYTHVLSLYFTSHLRSSVPALPKKGWSLHGTGDAVVEQRREELDVRTSPVHPTPGLCTIVAHRSQTRPVGPQTRRERCLFVGQQPPCLSPSTLPAALCVAAWPDEHAPQTLWWQMWLRRVVDMPRMAHNPDVLRFLGLFESGAAPAPEAEERPLSSTE